MNEEVAADDCGAFGADEGHGAFAPLVYSFAFYADSLMGGMMTLSTPDLGACGFWRSMQDMGTQMPSASDIKRGHLPTK